jgi:hypothetical protein
LNSLELELLRAKRLASPGASLFPSGKSGVIVTLNAVFAIWLYESRPLEKRTPPALVACLANIQYAKQQTSGRYFKEEV